MLGPIKIAPSILSADFMNLESEIVMLERAGADYIHVDVMDGHFVPNLTIGVPIVKQLKAITRLPLDVHLMISNPLEQLPWFLEAEPDLVTVHIEALDESKHEVESALTMIKEAGSKAGLSLKPDTAISAVFPYVQELDLVLVMSVYPGFSGQSYITGSEDRVAQLAHECRIQKVYPLIQVDGGIGLETVQRVALHGADVLVAGNAIFKTDNPSQAIKRIRRSAEKAQGVFCE